MIWAEIAEIARGLYPCPREYRHRYVVRAYVCVEEEEEEEDRQVEYGFKYLLERVAVHYVDVS